jgi:hypothetical protein
MSYPEEDHAKDLYRDIARRFADSVPATAVSLKGAGVNWDCVAERGSSSCSIHCFDAPGPEYYTYFRQDSNNVATGRTSSKPDTLDAVDTWLRGNVLSNLYERFPFVDREKRVLSSIREDLLERVPELTQSAPSVLRCRIGDRFELSFEGGDRSCQLSFCGNNEFPVADFQWDKCPLFCFNADDRGRLADVLKRWLFDKAMPSAIRAEFPRIQIGELADYYERGRPIEGEFIMSWNGIERLYNEMGANVDWPFLPKVRQFIAALRDKGYDRSLRAGQSMMSLIVSRSRRHGLRMNQPRIAFCFGNKGMTAHITPDGRKLHGEIEVTEAICSLLDRLAAADID